MIYCAGILWTLEAFICGFLCGLAFADHEAERERQQLERLRLEEKHG